MLRSGIFRALATLSLAALCLLGNSPLAAQPEAPGVQWERTFGGPCIDRATAVREADDGGYVAAGMTIFADDPLAVDVYLVKTDAEGKLLWERRFGGLQVDQALDMDKTGDGGFILTGATDGTNLCGLDCIDSRYHVYLLKVDGFGREVWHRKFGGGRGADSGHAVRATQDGGYVIAGITTSLGAGLADVYLIKTDAARDLEWERTFGGVDHDRAYAVEEAEDGGYVVAGRTEPRGRPTEILLLRADRSGELVWQRTIPAPRFAFGLAVRRTRDRQYVIAGCFARSDPFIEIDQDVYLVKVDGAGNLVWENNFFRRFRQTAASLEETSDAGFIVGGLFTDGFRPQSYLFRTDSTGNLLWETRLSGPGLNECSAVWPTRDGGYIVAGTTTLPIPPPTCNPTELYLARLGPAVVTSHPFIRGDADRDGEVNLRDAELVLSHLFFVYPFPRLLPCPDAGDVDDDGSVQINDAIYLLNHLFRRAPPPPPPYPEMAADPTADGLGC